MTAPGLRQIRDTATGDEARRAAVAVVDLLYHDRCGRVRWSCVCQSVGMPSVRAQIRAGGERGRMLAELHPGLDGAA